MTEKVRVVMQVSDDVREALRMAVARKRARTGERAELGDIVEELVEKNLPEILREVRDLRDKYKPDGDDEPDLGHSRKRKS